MTFILAYLDELSWLPHPNHGGDPLLGLQNSFLLLQAMYYHALCCSNSNSVPVQHKR